MSEHGDHQVRRNETAVLVDEHHTVRVAVKDHSDICLCFCHELLQSLDVLLHERVRLMVREASVHLFIDVGRLVAEDVTHQKRSHSVRHVHRDLKAAPVTLVLKEEGEIVSLYVHRTHLSLHWGRRALATAFHPHLYLSEACIQTHRKGVFTRDLETVVLGRIVRGCNLHRGLEAVMRGAEIDHRCRAESYVVHIRSGIGDALEQVFMYLRRRNPCVSSYKHLVCRKQLRKEITHLVGQSLVEVHIVDSSDVICVKCSHNLSL